MATPSHIVQALKLGKTWPSGRGEVGGNHPPAMKDIMKTLRLTAGEMPDGDALTDAAVNRPRNQRENSGALLIWDTAGEYPGQ